MASDIFTQIGSDIYGAAITRIGWSTSLSADGSVVAIGAPYDDGKGNVSIYKKENNNWIQVGSRIDGEGGGDLSGYSVSLSDDGSVVAIGAPHSIAAIGVDNFNQPIHRNVGHVRIYKNENNNWTQVGSDIDGEASGDQLGSSVSLSSDGTVVAIGAIGPPGADGNGTDSGLVRIFKNVNDTWKQIGSDIDGEAIGDDSGSSVSLSADGSVVAIAAPYNDGNGTDSGQVRIYKNVNDTWEQIGSDIDGEAAYDFSGSSVSLSFDGSVVAIGAESNGSNVGHVRIYKNENNTWTQIGADINGEATGDLSGSSVSLSSDGSVVAIGAIYNDGNGTNSGQVRIYKNVNDTWKQIGSDLDGEGFYDNSGKSVSLSADGSVVAIGAPYNDGNGTNSGQVRIFQIDDSVTLTKQIISASELLSLDEEYSGTVNASSVNTITGSASDVNSVYESLGITNLSNAAVTLSGTNTVSQVNSIAVSMFLANPLTPGLLTATISDNDIDTLSGISESGNALTITVTDTSVDASALTALDAKTSVAVGVNTTTITGTAAQVNAVYEANTAGTITGLGTEAVTISDTSIDASALKTLDAFTTGIIDASSITTLTGLDSDKATVRGSNGIIGLPASLLKIGNDIDGEFHDDEFGSSISLSADGSVVAIGAPNNDGNGTDSGHVTIYKWENNIGTQIGGDIDGEAAYDYSGWSISLSDDGSVVAIGANGANNSGSGVVRIYKNVNNSWIKIGDDIDGEADDDYSGQSVSLSADGSVVAIGADWNDGNGTDSGHVRIYKNINNTWTQVGSDIDGEASNDYSGQSVSLSNDGSVVAIGAYGNDGNGTDTGHVRIYENINNTWTQVGSDIDGEAAGDQSGSSISLSADGTLIAIGAQRNDGNGNDSGHVRIYENINNTWTQVGSDIDGEAAGDRLGRSVSLSADGTLIAIGAPHNSANGINSGHVRIYKNVNNIWTQVGFDIDGEAAGDRSGKSVSLSADGTVIAIGAPLHDGNGTDSGNVSLYSILETTTKALSDLEALQYIASNPDLIIAFGIDTTAATAHYENYGKSEGRSLTAFSASDYLAKYSDLSDAFGNDETLALKHYIQSGYAEGRTDSSSGTNSGSSSSAVSDSSSSSSSDSDSGSTTSSPEALSNLEALQYIASNPDLIGAFGTNIISAKSHWINYGYLEDRSITNFNPTNYLNNNPDLVNAFGSDTGFAIKHFITNGYAEGRTDSSSVTNSGSSSSSVSDSSSTSDSGSNSSSTSSTSTFSDFQALNYIASNIDLITAFGTDLEAAKSHYTNYGKSEGRPVDNFDEWGYLASNSDLIDAFGSDTTEAVKHFIAYGNSEGRLTNIFNADSYLNNYADLKNAFGNDLTLATKHYVESGFNEGRLF